MLITILIYEIIVTLYWVVYYNVMVNIPMCYSKPNYRKLVYKIIVKRGGYRITYFVAGYWIYTGYSAAGHRITYSIATLIYDNVCTNLQ